ncbi:hypothetical protein ADL19_10425 [Streptomyces purpurogeneiscleroticus]|nr:hypothetical protein ADL19_10425 [Streptomyces purpurogeneiscleroticus]
MLQTVRDACAFDPKAIDYALSEQIEDLNDLVGHTPQQAKAFFEKTYVTGGMRTLLRQGLQRLSGKSGQAVFELKQAMGGGKTHSMLALGYLAANPELLGLVPSEITAGFTPAKARVVSLSGRSISRERHLWGDIAEQLGKGEAFLDFYKGVPKAPNEKDWVSLIGDEPTLILLDELPPFFAYAITQSVGGGTLADITINAVSNLLAAALKKDCPRLCIVISNLSGSYEGATREITAIVSKATRDLQGEAGRQAKGITPVELGSDEIFHILRTRLLTKPTPESTVDAVASAFSDAISDAVKAKAVAKSAEQIADDIRASYPFHPSIKNILALFKDNERFRQTRGLMTLAAVMVRSALNRPTNDVFLVGCQHIDMSDPDIRETVTNIYDLSGAIAADVAGTASDRAHAQVIDDQTGTDAASQVARLILMSSLPEANGAVKGLNRGEAVANLVAPLRKPSEFEDAFEKLRVECWYLHKGENDAWVFARNENLKKKIEKYAEGAPQPKIDAEMQRRLVTVFEPRKKIAYTQVLALPKVEDIKPNGGRLLLVLSPDKKMPPEDARRLFEAVPQKNNFCVVTGDSYMAKLEDKVRRIWAVEKVKVEDGGDRSPNISALNEEAEGAEFAFNSTLINLFNRVYYPGRHPKTGEGLLYVPLKLVERKAKDGHPASVDGETAVEEALSGTAASKLYPVIDDTNADTLRSRAETVLWLSGDRRARLKDIEEQAICNPRWPWLPPKGLDEVRKRAVSTETWRDNGDGYIEKGPFPPARTGVKAITQSRDDETGKATIRLTVSHAGPNARIHFATKADVSASSPVLSDTIIERDETVLYFLAVDPDGKHETGEPERWSNTLTLTHERSEVLGKRRVSLDVKPRGVIRWNLDGTNPREGKLYDGPIEIPGNSAATVYAYAEDAEVTVRKEFTIPAPGGQKEIDPDKAAQVTRKVKLATTAETFVTLKAAKKSKATFGNGIAISVGKGDRNAVTRFGPGTTLSGEEIEAFIAAARLAVGDEAADVEVGFGEFRCATGREFEEFLSEVGSAIKVGPDEVQQ